MSNQIKFEAVSIEVEMPAGGDYSFDIEKYEEDEVTPINLTGTFELIISKDDMGKNVVLRKELDYVDNKLTVSLTRDETDIEPRKYYLGIRNDLAVDNSKPAYTGTLLITPFNAKK